jgi:hypothetical protein
MKTSKYIVKIRKKFNTSYPLAAYNDLNKKYKEKRRRREK